MDAAIDAAAAAAANAFVIQLVVGSVTGVGIAAPGKPSPNNGFVSGLGAGVGSCSFRQGAATAGLFEGAAAAAVAAPVVVATFLCCKQSILEATAI